MVKEFKGSSHEEVLGLYSASKLSSDAVKTYVVSIGGVQGSPAGQYESAFQSAVVQSGVGQYIFGTHSLDVLLQVDDSEVGVVKGSPSGPSPKYKGVKPLTELF